MTTKPVNIINNTCRDNGGSVSVWFTQLHVYN